MARPNIPIIILAAGASSRMRGRDKLLEKVDGQSLLRRQTQRAIAATDGPVLVTLPDPPHPRYGVLEGLDVARIPVSDAAIGMSASLRAGLSALDPKTQCAMVLLADLPELTTTDLTMVADAVDLDSPMLIWRGTTETGAPGHPIIFRRDLFNPLSDLNGDSGGKEVVASVKEFVKLVPLPGQRALLDLDTPEDWQAWRARQDQEKRKRGR